MSSTQNSHYLDTPEVKVLPMRLKSIDSHAKTENASVYRARICLHHPQASTRIPHCTYRSIRYVEKVAEGDMHLAETVVAAIPGRPVSGSGCQCAAPQNSVCDHTQGFVPFSCHRGIQSAHHRAFQALEAQVRCLLTLQMSIKARMTKAGQLAACIRTTTLCASTIPLPPR